MVSYFTFASSSTPVTYPTPTLPSAEIGVNLSGGEFAADKLPGRLGTDYVWPTSTEINYYDTRGFTLARIPFLPERICPAIGGGLNAVYRDALLAAVDAVRAKGMWAVLDLHGFWQYNGAFITEAQLTYIWTQLAIAVGTRNKVILGLMNEPNGVPATTVVAVQNTVINAIRAAGYVGVIAVSGTAYSGAHSWVTSGNAAAFTSLVPDPGVIFDIHQYLDADGAGDTANCVVGSSPTLAGDGVFRLSPFTTWARANGRKALLGEWSFTPGSTKCDTWAPDLLDYLGANDDVWCGHSYWANFPTAFGPWDSNPQLLNPLTDGTDRDQITVLTGYSPPGTSTYPAVRITAGTKTGTASQQATEANEFVNRCGCLMQQFDENAISAKLALKGRFSRTSAASVRNNQAAIRRLGDAGVKFVIHGGVYDSPGGTTVREPDSASVLLSTVKNVGPQYIVGVSVVNEPNHQSKIDAINRAVGGGATAYWAYLKDKQQKLYAAFKADAAVKDSVFVLGPCWAFNEEKLIPDIGNIDPWMDAHQCHCYAKARNIAERPDIYRNVAAAFEVGSSSKPVFMGEGGWNTFDAAWAPDTDAVERKNRFMPRYYLYHWDHNFTVINYLMDFGNVLTPGKWSFGDSQACYGWLKSNGEVQDSYTSCKNLFTIMNDPGGRFAPDKLAYTITGTTANVYYTLLQKRNGHFFLCIWVATYDNASRAITINLPGTITNARVNSPYNNTSFTTVPISGNKINFTVNGYVSIFELW